MLNLSINFNLERQKPRNNINFESILKCQKPINKNRNSNFNLKTTKEGNFSLLF